MSPKLLMCRDLELAVPGTYDPNQPIIRIQSIAPSLQVITSKQRPRKLTIMGKIFVGNVSGLKLGLCIHRKIDTLDVKMFQFVLAK